MIRRKIKPPNFNPQKYVAIDTETTGVNPWAPRVITVAGKEYTVTDSVFMVSMCDETGNTWCCNWCVNPYTREVTVNKDDCLFILKILDIPGIQVIFHNAKFDTRMLGNTLPAIKDKLIQIHNRAGLHDTLFMSRVANTLEISYGLKYLANKYLKLETTDEKDLQQSVLACRRYATSHNRVCESTKMLPILINTGKGNKEGEGTKADYWLPYAVNKLAISSIYKEGTLLCEKYCRLDTVRTMGLFLFYQKIIEEDAYLKATYSKEMQAVWPIVNSMEEHGVRVFTSTVKEEQVKCDKAMLTHYANMQKIIYDKGLEPFSLEEKYTKTGKLIVQKETSFNPGSSQQLMRVLYLPENGGGLGLKTDRRAKKPAKDGTYHMTTEKSVLAELMYCPFVQELVEYRNAAHAKSNFFSKIEEYIVKTDKGYDIVYFSFNQCGTKTGRFSGGGEGGVNGQQTSAGGKKSIGSSSYSSQKMFGPRPGYIFLDFDYSQQEARLFALLANVPIMLDAMKARVDPFRAMANKAWSGQGNPNSINAGILALELYKDKPSNTEIKELWDFYKWNKKIALNTSPKDTIISEIVDDWLSQFNYDIVEAEEALHKELSRQRSKHITYAKIFGGSAGSFAHLLLCDLATAKIFNDSFDAEIPQFKNYIQELSKQAKRDGYILNLYGRKLRVEYNFAYRAVSYKIQGTAADMMKTSLIKVHEYNKSIKADANIIMTIHDAMKIEILKRDYNVGYVRGVASRMENTDGIVGIHIPVECTYTDKAWSVEEKKIDIW